MKDNDHRLQSAATTHRINFVVAKSIENNAKNTPIKKTTKIQWCSNTTFGSRFRGKCRCQQRVDGGFKDEDEDDK